MTEAPTIRYVIRTASPSSASATEPTVVRCDAVIDEASPR